MNVYEKVVAELKSKSDAEYKKFNDKITKTEYETIGVRMPEIKRVAKSVDKAEIEEYLEKCEFRYFEDTLIYGLLLPRLGLDEFWKRKDEFLTKCDSWSHIDCFVSELKPKASEKEKLYSLLTEGIDSLDGFALRFRIVALMNFYVGGDRTEEILRIVERLDGRGFYNDMAIAWLLQVALVKRREETLVFMQNNSLSRFTQNKAISKMQDSFRIGEDDKIYLKTLRK